MAVAIRRSEGREQRDDRGDYEPVNRFRALTPRFGLQGLDFRKVVSHGMSFQANETEASPSASMTATPSAASR
jgi:hypothetical protein